MDAPGHVTLAAPGGRNLRPGPSGPVQAQRRGSYDTWVCGTWEALEDRLQYKDEDWGSRTRPRWGRGCNNLRSHFVLALLPSSLPSCRVRTPPFRPCALPCRVAPRSGSRPVQSLAGSQFARPLPPPSVPPARALGRRERRSGCALPPSGVTEDSRARALAAPPALSPGQFAERGRE